MELPLDQLDYRIVSSLQQDANITNVRLAEKIGLSPAATLERVKRLETQGIIRSYHARLDSQALDLTVQLWLQVCLHFTTPESIQHFQKSVESIQEVVACYHVVGAADFLLHVFANNVKAYQQLLVHKLGPISIIKSITTFGVLDTIKETGLPLGHLSISPAH